MAKASRGGRVQPKPRSEPAPKARSGTKMTELPLPARTGWATDLVFDVREPKLAVSLRLDADVLRFFRGFGGGYQTRINEVLKAFMQARCGAEPAGPAAAAARPQRAPATNGKRAAR